MQLALRRDAPALTPARVSLPRRDASVWIAGALLGAFLVVFLVQALPRITGPFGDNHWATRLPAWLGAIATVLMLSWILRARGLPPVACAGGVVLAFASPMFLLYGTMLDTLQTSLPFAVGLFLVWDRRRSVDAPRWPIAVLAALSALSSWEAALFAAVLVAVDIATMRPRRLRSIARLPTLQGLAAGVASCLAWLWWSAGSLSEIASQMSQRPASGGRAWTIGDWFDFQATYLQDLISPIALVLALIGIWFAVRDPRLRMPFAVFGSVVVVYPLVVPDAAIHHDYWNYWVIVPMAIAITGVLATVEERRSNRLIVHVSVVLLAGLAVVAGLKATSYARSADRDGRTTADAYETAIEDHGQIPFVAGVIPPARWITNAGHSATRISGSRAPTATNWSSSVVSRIRPG